MFYKHPGVYIEEDKSLALSVPAGETAVPVFVGVFLDQQSKQPITTPRCTKIHNWKEFEDQFYVPFGGPSSLTVMLTSGSVTNIEGYTAYLGAPSVRAHFENGGGPCYVLPVKRQPDYTEAAKLIPDLVREHPEISLLCYCELTDSDSQIYAAFGQLLNDKAGYFMLADGDEEEQPSITVLEQAAIYYPALRMTYRVAAPKDEDIALTIDPAISGVTNLKTLKEKAKESAKAGKEKSILLNKLSNANLITKNTTLNELKVKKSKYEFAYDDMSAVFDNFIKKSGSFEEGEHNKMLGQLGKSKANYQGGYAKQKIGELFEELGNEGEGLIKERLSELPGKVDPKKKDKIEELINGLTKADSNWPALYKAAKEYINQYFVKEIELEAVIQKILDALNAWSIVYLRASVAMAGVYARTDRERGVWKAPANTTLNSVEGLVWHDENKKIIPKIVDDARQDTLNPVGINAIRYFSGRGFTVWGARTLAGKDAAADKRWHYVPVRRLFNAAERDIKQAMRAVMFEPNNAPTWEKVRAAIDIYLHNLWHIGALQGAKPEEAYFVQVGKGVTMTDDEIQRGHLIVKVGMAAVRPAEFIILRFTQDVAIATTA